MIYLLLILGACATPETTSHRLPDLTVSGEFLFEGPNTLQGQPALDLEQIARSADLSPGALKAVYIQSATISIYPDSLQPIVESALVQWVSDDLPLVSVATRSPFPQDGTVELEVNREQDILPYLKDSTTTLVVDTNLGQDLDYLEAAVSFELTIKY